MQDDSELDEPPKMPTQFEPKPPKRKRKPHPKLSRSAMQRTLRLLNMQYKPSEVATELGIDVQTVYRVFIPAGCPYQKDDKGNLWIVGTEFRTWIENTLRVSKRRWNKQQTSQTSMVRSKKDKKGNDNEHA